MRRPFRRECHAGTARRTRRGASQARTAAGRDRGFRGLHRIDRSDRNGSPALHRTRERRALSFRKLAEHTSVALVRPLHDLLQSGIAFPVAHRRDHDDISVGRDLELRAGVDSKLLEQGFVQHQGEAVAGLRQLLAHVRTIVQIGTYRIKRRPIPAAARYNAWPWVRFARRCATGTALTRAPSLRTSRTGASRGWAAIPITRSPTI